MKEKSKKVLLIRRNSSSFTFNPKFSSSSKTQRSTPSSSLTSKRSQSPFFAPHAPRQHIYTTPNGSLSRVQDVDDIESKSSILGAAFNLCNNVVGAGIVSIPFAISQCSFVLGIFMVVIFGVMTVKSLRLLIETAKHVNVQSYERLAEASFGKSGFTFISVAMFIMAYGGMVGYLMIVKSNLSYLFGIDRSDIMMQNAVLVISSLTVLLPIAMQRDMGNLSKTSIISVIFDCILVGIIAYFSPVAENIEENGGIQQVVSQSKFDINTFFTGIGVLCFAFVCQHSSFIIASSLERPTKERWNKVTGLAISIMVILAIIMGTGGYLGYLTNTDGDILLNLGKYAQQVDLRTQKAVVIARGLLCMTMFFVYPMELFVARHVCVVLLFKGRRAHEGDDHAILARRDRRLTVTTGIYLLTLIPALIASDLGQVFALSGALGGATLSYMGPGILYLAVHGDDFLTLIEKKWGYDYVRQYNNNSMELNEEYPMNKSNAILHLFDNITWYILLMPVWCQIACRGKIMMAKHEEEEAQKSPFPYAFGQIVHHKQSQQTTSKYSRFADLERASSMGSEHDNNLTRVGSVPAILKPANSFSSCQSSVSTTMLKQMNDSQHSYGSTIVLKPLNDSQHSYKSALTSIRKESFASSYSQGSDSRSKKASFIPQGVTINSNEKERLLSQSYLYGSSWVLNEDSFKEVEEDNTDIDHVHDNENIGLELGGSNDKNELNASSMFVNESLDSVSNAGSIHTSPSSLNDNNDVEENKQLSTFYKNVKSKSSEALKQLLQLKDNMGNIMKGNRNVIEVDYEDDPQDDPPSVIDYITAVYYIIFGFVAALTGVYSAFT